MANQKGRKPATRKRKVEKDEGLKPYQDEITIVFTLVFCILLILSNFNMCGIFGVWVSRLFFGLFGFMNYILPFGIFIGMAFYLSNKGSRKARRKLISVIVLMVVLMALLQLSYTSYEKGTHILAYYEASSESRLGGGMIGGFISGALCYCFDEIASVVILIGIGLLLCMFITEKLFFAPMGKRGYQKMQEMKEYRRVQREEYERNTPVQKQAPVKRKAKTFTIEREPIPDPVKPKAQESVDQNGVIKKEKLGRKSKKKTSVDMEEITPSGIDTMSIVRAEVPKNDESMPVYEEELKNKFNPVNAKMETDLEEINPSNTKFGADVKMEVSNEIETSAEIMNYDAIEPEDMVEPQEVTKVHSSVRESGSLDKKTDMKPSGQASTKVHKSENMSEPKEDIVKGSDIADIQTIKENTVIDVPYQSPSTELLKKPVNTGAGMSDQELKDTAWKLHQTLESFGVKVTITNVSCGPSVTRYELHPEQGVKVSKITGLADDIKLNLAAADVRIEAPIPGKAAVGIEVPNKENTAVMLRELLESSEFKKHSSNIAFAVGKDIAGKTVVSDIAKMPHLLIAGATGSGKSVCI
ncbi:MAG TPA: cell division protein FtsK, partial [Lachnospiraceae bacterium]|nr:cell division protein FtsK [Lachnospiraceae bacterium]